MTKIAISTLVWKRPEIFEIWAENVSNLVPKPMVLVAGSQGDQCQEIAIRYGFKYIQTQNKFLGKKANESVKLAKDLDCEYIMLTGSDDIISQKMWDYYNGFEGDVLGLIDYYFLNMEDLRMIHWKGYKNSARVGEPIGANKLIRKSLIEKMNFEPYSETSRHPDEHDTHVQLKKMGICQTIVTVESTGGMSIDLKSGQSITRFAKWNNSDYVNIFQTLQGHDDLYNLLMKHSQKLRDRREMMEKQRRLRNR